MKNKSMPCQRIRFPAPWIFPVFLVLILVFGNTLALAQTQETPPKPIPVTLQLSWSHGYQFAGYYVAQALGFYEDVGLDVTIKARVGKETTVRTLLNGDAQFGIWSPELLVYRSEGIKVQALAAIFQHNPMVVLLPKNSGIDSPGDLVGKRVFFPTTQKNVTLEAMFKAEGVNLEQLVHVDAEQLTASPLDDLLAGRLDALALYVFDVPKKYSPVSDHFEVMYPSTYGIDFYGDMLFTTDGFASSNTEIVRNFKAASTKGWQFALIHGEMAAEAVQPVFFPDVPIEELLATTDQLERLIQSKKIEIGRINIDRLQRIQDTYHDLGLIHPNKNLEGFIFDEVESTAPVDPLNRLIYPLVLLIIALGSALFHYRKQKLLAVQKARDLDQANIELTWQIKQGNDNAFKMQEGLEGMGAALWAWILVSDKFQVSTQLLEEMGYTRENVIQKASETLGFIHPDDRKNVQDSFRLMARNRKEVIDLEFRLRHANGNYLWIQSRAYASRDSGGRILRIMGSLTNVTDRFEAENERDRLFNLSIDLLAVSGFDGFLQQVNPAWVRLLGWSRDDLMGHPILFFVHPIDQNIASDAMAQIAAGNPIEHLEFRFRCRDSSYRWLSWSSFPYKDRKLIFSVVRDITENKLAQNQLLTYQTRLQNLSNQMSLIEDRQRRQLAEAIHDGLAQQLFAARAQVVLLKYPEKVADYSGVIESILEILDDSMRDARSLSFELFPPVLYEVGLDAALSWLSRNFSNRTEIQCNVAIEGEGEGAEIPEDVRAMAYQSVRELLANVQKHSQAEMVNITINHVEDFLTILVEDNGIGFNHNDPHGDYRFSGESGFGLFSIRERLHSVNGRLLVDSAPGKGCRIFLSFPADKSARDLL